MPSNFYHIWISSRVEPARKNQEVTVDYHGTGMGIQIITVTFEDGHIIDRVPRSMVRRVKR